MIKGGVRENIIPDSVEMRGTIRSFDEEMRDDIHERVTTLAESIATRVARRPARVCITKNYPVTVNDPALTEAMAPTLARVAGEGKAQLVPKVMGSEDFSFFQRVVPGPVLLPRRRARGPGPARRGAEPLAALLHRREEPGGRRARAGARGLRLPRGEAAGALRRQRRSVGSGRRGPYQMSRRERSSTPARPARAMRRLPRTISQAL